VRATTEGDTLHLLPQTAVAAHARDAVAAGGDNTAIGRVEHAPPTTPTEGVRGGMLLVDGSRNSGSRGWSIPRTPVGMLIPGPNRWTPSCACSPGTTTARAETPTLAPAAAPPPPSIYEVGGAPLGHWWHTGMRGRMVGRAPLRQHRPRLCGGVVETTQEGALGRATCRAGAHRKPSPLLDVGSVVAGVSGGAGAGVNEGAGADAGGADGTPSTCVPRLG